MTRCRNVIPIIALTVGAIAASPWAYHVAFAAWAPSTAFAAAPADPTPADPASAYAGPFCGVNDAPAACGMREVVVHDPPGRGKGRRREIAPEPGTEPEPGNASAPPSRSARRPPPIGSVCVAAVEAPPPRLPRERAVRWRL